jgi:hypothetical protein
LCTTLWSAGDDPGAERGGCLHTGVSGVGSGHQFRQPESDADAGGIVAERGQPLAIRCDNGPELTSRHFLAWCVERQIELVHIQPGKPAQNGSRELQRAVARRVFERRPLPLAPPIPAHTGEERMNVVVSYVNESRGQVKPIIHGLEFTTKKLMLSVTAKQVDGVPEDNRGVEDVDNPDQPAHSHCDCHCDQFADQHSAKASKGHGEMCD